MSIMIIINNIEESYYKITSLEQVFCIKKKPVNERSSF